MSNSQEIIKAIDKLAKCGQAFQKLAQDTAVSVAVHFAEHKDTGLVNRLYLAMPKGSNKEAMARWIMAFLAVVPNTDAKTKADQPFLFDRQGLTDAKLARETMWYDLKVAKSPDAIFDFSKAVMHLVRKASKATETKGFDAKARAALRDLAITAGIPASDVPDFGLTKATTPASKEAQRPSKGTTLKGKAAQEAVNGKADPLEVGNLPALLTTQAA